MNNHTSKMIRFLFVLIGFVILLAVVYYDGTNLVIENWIDKIAKIYIGISVIGAIIGAVQYLTLKWRK